MVPKNRQTIVIISNLACKSRYYICAKQSGKGIFAIPFACKFQV